VISLWYILIQVNNTTWLCIAMLKAALM